MIRAIRRYAALLQHPTVQGAIALALTGYGLGKLTNIVDQQRGSLERATSAADDARADLARVNTAVANGRQILRELNRAIVQAAGAVPEGTSVVDVDELLARTDPAQAQRYAGEDPVDDEADQAE